MKKYIILLILLFSASVFAEGRIVSTIPNWPDITNKPTTIEGYGITDAAGLEGPPGPQGEQGIQGIQGEPGIKGDAGDPGDAGQQGIKGDTGADSTVPGPQGSPGDQGIQGVQGDQGIQGPPSPTPAQLLVCAGAAALTWTNMPAAATFFGGANRNSITIDLTNYTQARFSVIKLATAGAAASKLILRYFTSYTTTLASYLDIGVSEVSMALNVQNQLQQTGWIDLAAGAKANVSLALIGSGGDGALDPQFGNIWAEFK